MRRTAIVLMGVLAGSGCFSSGYVGRDPRKVYMTMKDGMRGYTRNGEFHAERGFGGGLVDAVGDNPEAMRAAQTFRGRTIGGFLMTLAGTLCLPAVLTYDITRSIDNESGFPRSHGYLLIGCGVLAIAGATYMVSGLPYQLDAVNIYNDAVDARPVQWPPAPAPRLPLGPSSPPGPPGPPAPPDPSVNQGPPGS